MASRLPDGSIQLNDGRILYSDSILYGDDFLEIFRLFIPSPAWPLIGGGGGGVGAQGKDGVQGAQGVIGGTGGPQGWQGFQGLIGVLGNQGNQGNQGLVGTGPQGIQGAQGFQSAQGNQGLQGAQGPQGAQGFQGFSGLSGSQGNQGNQGQQGTQGTGGPTQASVFDFTHLSGASSTGALGFTPKFAFYSGVIQQPNGGGGLNIVHSTGIAIGTGSSSKTAALGVGSSTGVSVDIGGAASSTSGIAVDTTMSTSIDWEGGNGIELDVTAFGAGGITLTWGGSVAKHEGKLIVVGN